jgi:hypothetical protein
MISASIGKLTSATNKVSVGFHFQAFTRLSGYSADPQGKKPLFPALAPKNSPIGATFTIISQLFESPANNRTSC